MMGVQSQEQELPKSGITLAQKQIFLLFTKYCVRVGDERGDEPGSIVQKVV